MATVEFQCPRCGQICGFHDRYIGRRARCTQCNTQFLIPPAGQPAKALKPVYVDEGPWSGFWTALVRQSPNALLNPVSLVVAGLLVFSSIIRYCFGHPFFAIHIPFFFVMLPVPVGIFVTALTVGFQCRCLFDVIQSTADQNEPLPWPFDEGTADRLFASIAGAYALALLFAICIAPTGAVWWIVHLSGFGLQWPIAAAAAVGLFFFPLSLTIYAYSRDLLLALRFDYILRASLKAFWPHLILYIQVVAIVGLLWTASLYRLRAPAETVGRDILFHILGTGLGIMTARTAGLFYRHYGCYLP